MFHPFISPSTSSPFLLNQEDLKRKSANTSHAVPSLNIVCYTYEKRAHILHRNHYNKNESFAFTIRMIYILNPNNLHSIQADGVVTV